MEKFLQFCFLLFLSFPTAALDNGHAKYVGGTVPGITAGVVGRLDTISETALTFVYAGSKVTIPYASIQSFEYKQEVARHLGVLPAIAVGLIKARQHHHFFRITYRDSDSEMTQVVMLQVPKHTPRVLGAILHARTPVAGKNDPSIRSGCGCTSY